VLPSNLDQARRMTYARLPVLARKANMRLTQRQLGKDQELERTSPNLGRLRTQMTLEGGYESVRQFLFELETTPDFIIVDDVSLGQSEANKPVTLTVALSTYYGWIAMEPKRQREITLAIIALLLAVAAYTACRHSRRTARLARHPSSKSGSAAGRKAGNAVKPDEVEAPDVHLQALNEGRPRPSAGRRIVPLSDEAAAASAAAAALAVGRSPATTARRRRAQITLKFIGVIDMPPPAQRGSGAQRWPRRRPYGHEGETVLGQCRILPDWAESIEMSYLDGRGRQTIRLSGS
jgi:hypothetical protein